ncbi:MAG: hypothetical protein ACREHG_04985 [Candidatus Saccharimonadales bacterium]
MSIAGIVTANVVPKIKYLGNFTGVTAGIDVSEYNALIIAFNLTATGYSSIKYGYMELTPSDSASGVALPPSYYFLQSSVFNNNVAAFSNMSQTVFPLHGMDTLDIGLTAVGTGQTLSADIFGTTESLPELHRTQEFSAVSHILMQNELHVMPSGGSTFPIPVSSKPVRIYAHVTNTNAGATQAMQLVDTVTSALIMNGTVPKGSNFGQAGLTNSPNPYILLPHTMSPMTLFTGSATSGDTMDIFVTDDV